MSTERASAAYSPSSHSSTTTKMSLNHIDAAMASPLPQIIAAGTTSIVVVSDSIRSAVDYGSSFSAEDGAEDDYYDDDSKAASATVAAIAGWVVAVDGNPFVGTCVDMSDMSAHSFLLGGWAPCPANLDKAEPRRISTDLCDNENGPPRRRAEKSGRLSFQAIIRAS